MAEVLSVLWTVVPQVAPQPYVNCSRCGEAKPFHSSQKFRVNVNGKRVDAWLIYKCPTCNNTWNRPVLERRNVDSVVPSLLEALRRNDPEFARLVAFDSGDLPRRTATARASASVVVRKEMLSEASKPPRWLAIRLTVSQPVALRLDRLLARELGLSRKRLHALQEDDCLAIAPDGPRMLRKPLRDGTCLTVDLSRESDAARIGAAAVGAS